MAASAADLFQEVGTPGTATTLSAPGYTTGVSTSVTVASTTNWPSATGVTFAIDVVDSAGERVAGTYNEFVGTVASGTSVTSVSRTYGTAQNYAAGATTRVYIPVSSTRENRLVQGLLAEHNQLNGYHTLTSNTTATSSKFITALNDTNGNELFKVTATASAVNEFTVANAATGNPPEFAATGGDTDISMKVTPKGAGAFLLPEGKTAGLIRDRQGGSSTNWGTAGTTNYDYAASKVFEEVGTASGNSGADVTVTFPTAFSQVPNIVAVASTAASANTYVVIATKSATNFTFRCIDAGGTQRSEEIFWRAIGE